MASLLQKLSTALLRFLPGQMVPEMHLMDAAPGFRTFRHPAYGTSKRTVAQDRRCGVPKSTGRPRRCASR